MKNILLALVFFSCIAKSQTIPFSQIQKTTPGYFYIATGTGTNGAVTPTVSLPPSAITGTAVTNTQSITIDGVSKPYGPGTPSFTTAIPTIQQVTDAGTITTNIIEAAGFNTNGIGFDETNFTALTGDGSDFLFEIDRITDIVKYKNSEIATINQLPVITASTNITVTGTTPNYTISSTTNTTGLQSQLNGTGFVKATGTTISYDNSTYLTAAGDVTTTAVQTLTNKRITLRTFTVTTTPTVSVNSDSYDMVSVTTLSTATTFTAPTGTPTWGQGLFYAIKDNGMARALTFNSAFRFSSDIPAPATTIVSKWMYMIFSYNWIDSKWDCLYISTNY